MVVVMLYWMALIFRKDSCLALSPIIQVHERVGCCGVLETFEVYPSKRLTRADQLLSETSASRLTFGFFLSILLWVNCIIFQSYMSHYLVRLSFPLYSLLVCICLYVTDLAQDSPKCWN